jgi:hypothetical protein
MNVGQKPMTKKICIAFVAAVFGLLAVTTNAAAQNGGYTIHRPGQLPTYANPTPNGGYTVQTPGQLPTYVNPR